MAKLDPKSADGPVPGSTTASRFSVLPVFSGDGEPVDTGALKPGDPGYLEALAKAAGFTYVDHSARPQR